MVNLYYFSELFIVTLDELDLFYVISGHIARKMIWFITTTTFN